MTANWLLAFTIGVSSASCATLELEGPAFTPIDRLEIVWEAPSNALPSTLRIYKVVPQEFSREFVTTLMEAGSFSQRDKARIRDHHSSRDKRNLYFESQDKAKHLVISPALGWARYYDEKARTYGRERATGVPTESEALELAIHYLDRLGIYQTNLAYAGDPPTIQVYRNVRERSFFDREKREPVKETISRGVSFVRALDGVNFTGIGSDGGVSITFGSEARIAELEVVWRKLRPGELRSVASPAQFTSRIRRGQAKIVGSLDPRPDAARRLTIQRVTPFDLGDTGNNPQTHIYPFAALEGLLQFHDGTEARLVLKCQILAEPSDESRNP